jgi:hypothetical protein
MSLSGDIMRCVGIRMASIQLPGRGPVASASVSGPMVARHEWRPVVGRHSEEEHDPSAAPPSSSRRLRSRQPPRTARRGLLPVVGTLAALAVAVGTASMVLGSGKVSVGSADHPAAPPARTGSPAGMPQAAVPGSSVMIGFAGIAQVAPASQPAHPPRKSAPPVTSTPRQAPGPVSTLQNLPINTELTGSQAVAWARAALAALGAPATSANVQTMLDWFSNEGTPHDYNNPLNLNVPYGGSTISTADGDPPPVHIQAYPTPADFVKAFAIEIGDNPSYPAITTALRSGVGLEGSAANAEIASELLVYSGGGYHSIPGWP